MTAPRVLVARPAGSGGALVDALRGQGIDTCHHPLIQLEPVGADSPEGRSLRDAVEGLRREEAAWLVLTSSVAIDALDPLLGPGGLGGSGGRLGGSGGLGSSRGPGEPGGSGGSGALHGSGEPGVSAGPGLSGGRLGSSTPGAPDAEAPAPLWSGLDGAQVAVVGRATAATLRDRGLEPDLVAGGSGRSLIERMPAGRGELALFIGSAAASPTVPEGLAALGYAVRREIAYRPEPAELPIEAAQDLREGRFAAIVLSSAMIARCAAAIGIGEGTRVITIGAPTTAAAREAGLRVHAQAHEPSTDGLLRACLMALER